MKKERPSERRARQAQADAAPQAPAAPPAGGQAPGRGRGAPGRRRPVAAAQAAPAQKTGGAPKLRVRLSDVVGIKEAARHLPRHINSLQAGEHECIAITRSDEPVGVIITPERYCELLEMSGEM